jgi:hypothetical protein
MMMKVQILMLIMQNLMTMIQILMMMEMQMIVLNCLAHSEKRLRELANYRKIHGTVMFLGATAKKSWLGQQPEE